MSRKKRQNKLRSRRRPKAKRPVPVPATHATFRIQLEKLPAGYAMNDCEPGDEALVLYKGFSSSEDGDLFISRLEGVPRTLINLIRSKYKLPLSEGDINCMVAVIRQDKSVAVHINPPGKVSMQKKTPRPFRAGECIYANDVSDVRELVFERIDIPDDAGVIVVFSVGWRKGLFFDFGPLAPEPAKREYDLGILLGGYYSYLLFRNLFELSEENWQTLLDQQWFPFISLSSNMTGKIVESAKRGKEIDELLPKIKDELDSILPSQIERWGNTAAFKPHIAFLREAHDQYRAGKHISCLSVLFPRIEGILRTFQQLIGSPLKSGQRDLAEIMVSDSVNPKHPIYSPMLPARFNKYLTDCFFADFDPASTEHRLSRNSVGHGVANTEAFNLKGSVLGFLILCQLGLYFAGVEKKGA